RSGPQNNRTVSRRHPGQHRGKVMLRIPGPANPFFGSARGSAARLRTNKPRGPRGRLRCRPVLMELEHRQLLSLTTLASFNGANGAGPQAGVIMDGSGNLYGTAFGGGALGAGTVFELAHGSHTITTLASFNGGSNGSHPNAGVIMDSSGNLYGTTI